MRIPNQIVKPIVGVIVAGIIFISAHLTYNELTITNTGLPNKPDSIALVNLKYLADSIYEPCRQHFNKPIYVSSAYRSRQVNSTIGGKMRSQHLKGEAMDLDANRYGGLTNRELAKFIKDSLDYDQLIEEGGYNGWIHVSYKIKGNRKQSFSIVNP